MFALARTVKRTRIARVADGTVALVESGLIQMLEKTFRSSRTQNLEFAILSYITTFWCVVRIKKRFKPVRCWCQNQEAIQARQVLVSESRSDSSPSGAGVRIKKRFKPVSAASPSGAAVTARRCWHGIKKPRERVARGVSGGQGWIRTIVRNANGFTVRLL
jgi:hypothetical protein